jgi:cbb3-type cytochrome oxidase maturation protein
MTILAYLIPDLSRLGGLGLVFFVWTVRTNQYDDPEGDARRILSTSMTTSPSACFSSC